MPTIDGLLYFDRELTQDEVDALAKAERMPASENVWRLDRFNLLDTFLSNVEDKESFPEWRAEREWLRRALRAGGYDIPPEEIHPPEHVDLTLSLHGSVWWVVNQREGLEVWNGQRGGMHMYRGGDDLPVRIPPLIWSEIERHWERTLNSAGFLVPEDSEESVWLYQDRSWHLRWDRLDTVVVTPGGGEDPFTWTLGRDDPTPDGTLLEFWFTKAVLDGVAVVEYNVDDVHITIRVLPSGQVWYDTPDGFFFHEGEDDPVPPGALRVAQHLYSEHAELRDRARAPLHPHVLIQSANPPAPLAFGVSDGAGGMVNKLEVWHDHFVVDGVRVEVDHPNEARRVLDSFLVTVGEVRHDDPNHFFSSERKGLPTIWDHLDNGGDDTT